MAVNGWIIERTVDLAHPPKTLRNEQPYEIAYTGDMANPIWTVHVLQDGQPVALGGSVKAYIKRIDGAEIVSNGTIIGNTVSVQLGGSNFGQPGYAWGILRYTDSTTNATITLDALTMIVQADPEGTSVLDPDDMLPTLPELLAELDDMRDATAAAEAAAECIADDYSTSATYAVGDYVLHNGGLYRCTTAITTAEAWTAEHWTQVVFGAEVANLKSGLKATGSLVGLKWYNGYYNQSDGSFVTTEYWKMSNSIPCTSGDTFTYCGASSQQNRAVIVFFDKDGAQLERRANLGTDYTEVAVVVPNGAEYFRVLGYTDRINDTYIIYGVHASQNPMFQNRMRIISLESALDSVSDEVIVEKEKLAGMLLVTDVIGESKAYFEKGGINSSGNTDFGSDSRIRTKNIHHALNTFSLYIDSSSYSNAGIYVHLYDASGNYTGDSGAWVKEYTITKDTYYRLVITPDTTTTTTVYTIDTVFGLLLCDNQKYNKVIAMVSHQGNVNKTDNHCKAEGYALAGRSGFDFGETDLRFTSDGVPVCCHDDTFVDGVSGETITILNETYADLVTYNYYGGTIASLDEVVKVCKESGIGLYIDQYMEWFGDHRYKAVFDILDKYRYTKMVKHIVYGSASATAILQLDPHAHLIAGQSHSSIDASAAMDLADTIKTNTNKVDVMLWQGLGKTIIEDATTNMNKEYGLYIYRCDTPSEKHSMLDYATAICTNMSSALYM